MEQNKHVNRYSEGGYYANVCVRNSDMKDHVKHKPIFQTFKPRIKINFLT